MIYLLLVAFVCLAIAGFKITLMREELDAVKAARDGYCRLLHEEESCCADARKARDRNGAEIEKLCGQINRMTKKKAVPKRRGS